MLSLLVAVAENNVIGLDNKLLWRIPEDLARFKQITMGKTIIMGRKTFESLPKILPGRHHIVLTNDKNYSVDSEQVTVVHSLDEILNKFSDSEEEAFIIGGGQIYNLTFPHCSKFYLTKVYRAFDKADTFFPEIDYSNWKEVYSSGRNINTSDGIEFEFVDYERIR